MIAEANTFITNMKAVYDISKAMIGIRDAVQMNEKILELQNAIMDAQGASKGVKSAISC